MSKSKTSTQNISAREREIQALSLRREGQRYDQIGKALGVSESGAWRIVQRAYARSLKVADDEANFNRKLDLERLDTALAAIWKQVEAGRLFAIDRLIAILERRARLLGLDATESSAMGAVRREYVGVDLDAV